MEQDPNFPDALFLKAQILWEGFKDSTGAKGCLDQVIKLVPDQYEPLHRWAVHLLSEIACCVEVLQLDSDEK